MLRCNKRGEAVIEKEQSRLRDLASWYREFAERAENPVIWDGRLRTAESLEAEADRIESAHAQ